MHIKRIAHTCLLVKDLAESLKFYTDAMGFKKVFDFTREDAVAGCYLTVDGSSYVELFEHPDPVEGQSRLSHVCFETEDIEALKAALEEKGVKCGDIKKGADHSWQFWVTDPSGIRIEFHQYTDESCQQTGQNAELN